MIEINYNGIQAYANQLMWSQEYSERVLIAASICGREVTVRALVAHFLTTGRLEVEIDQCRMNLSKNNQTATIKGKKISPEFYQVLIWNADEKPNVIRKQEFFSHIENNFSVPFHTAWAEPVWQYFVETGKINPLESYGIKDEFHLAWVREETLQSLILSRLDELKGLLKKAA